MSNTLPPLPPHVGEENHGPSQQPVKLYDAAQMQAYALAAIEAQGVPDETGTAYQKLHAKWRKGRQELANLTRAHEALKVRLASAPQASEVQQEPVAWKHDCAVLLTSDVELWIDACPHCGKPRTHPAKQAKPLTDEQGLALAMGLGWEVEFDGIGKDALELIRAVEAAHGIKE